MSLSFFFTATATTEIYTLSLHDALPICPRCCPVPPHPPSPRSDSLPHPGIPLLPRSEEHTSELQSRFDLVCRLLLEKKKKITHIYYYCSVRHHTYLCLYNISTK